MIFFFTPCTHSQSVIRALRQPRWHSPTVLSDILVTRTFLALLSESLDFCDAVSVSESVTWKSASAVM